MRAGPSVVRDTLTRCGGLPRLHCLYHGELNPIAVRPDSRQFVGTGLVGAALCDAGFDDIHGVDLSPEMAGQAARRGVYVTVESGVDLSVDPPERLQHSADIVTVGGVFAVGQVAPSALIAMAKLPVSGAILVVSTREAYVQDTNFCDVLQDLLQTGVLRLLVREANAPYTMDSNGDYWAFEVS